MNCKSKLSLKNWRNIIIYSLIIYGILTTVLLIYNIRKHDVVRKQYEQYVQQIELHHSLEEEQLTLDNLEKENARLILELQKTRQKYNKNFGTSDGSSSN